MRRILLTLLIAISSVLAIQAQGDVTGGATVVRAEYFFDSDPGYGNATIINNVTEGDNELSLSVEDLSPGAHMLYVRSQASSGVWSSTQSHPLLLVRQRPAEAVRVEYFYDTDPGYGNGVSVGNLTDGDNTLVVSVAGLAYGVHHLCLRAQDNTGVWSQVATYSVFVTSPTTANAVRIEYFFDTDPGFGQATPITPSQDEEATYALSLDNLSMGAHMLYLRVQDNHGRWSAVQKHPIYVLSNLPDVVAVEYFFDDNDPGEGQATAVPLPSVKMDPFAFEANTAGLAPGEHHLMVRLQKNNGFWTIFDAATFTVEGPAEPEPYAAFSDDNTVLTFYYDTKKEERSGMGVGPFSPSISGSWGNKTSSITTVVFDESFAGYTSLTSTSYWFSQCKKLTTIVGMENLNTSGVTKMDNMFLNCEALTSLDLSSLNTSEVTWMDGMIRGCTSLTEVNLSNFNTEKVESTNSMFYGCHSLKTIDLSSFATPKLSYTGYMFFDCTELTTIYASEEWTVEKVTESSLMFSSCNKLVGGMGTVFSNDYTGKLYARIDGGPSNPGYFTDKNAPAENVPYAVLSDNNTILTFYYDDQKVARGGMDIGPFDYYYDQDDEGNRILKDTRPSLWVDNADKIITAVFDDSFAECTTITSTKAWFDECHNLTTIVGIGNLKTDNAVSLHAMFSNCYSLTDIDVSGFNTDNVEDMGYMFSGCSSLTSLDVSMFNTKKVWRMKLMFDRCSGLTSLDLSNFDTSNVTDMSSMFYGCSGLTSLDLSNFDTSNVTDMNCLFYGCSGLTSLDLSNFKTDNVTDMSWMFRECSGLTSLDLSNFNTANVTNMRGMFTDCSSLTSLDLSNFNTANVTNMGYLFYNNIGLTSLDVSNFNTDNVTDMRYMFYNSILLTSLDVSNFNTDNVTDMSGMFRNCFGLTNLDISNFNTANVTDMGSMFKGCSELITIYAGEGWSTEKVTESTEMFFGCPNLVGGMGTVYDADHVDAAYAHIDGGPSNPGYLSDKNAPVITNPEGYAVLSDNNTVLTFYYDDQKEQRNGMGIGPFLGYDARGWHDQRESITNVIFDASFANDTTLTSTAHWFYDCRNLTTITGIGNLRSDNVTDMRYMFRYCTNLTELDVSGFNTENVVSMRGLFSHCSSLTNLDVSGFRTDNVTDMMDMFDDCSKLTSIDVSHFNTEKVTTLSVMFQMCSSLTSLDLSNFNTSNVTNTQGMFYGCSDLVSLNVRTFDMSKVNNAEKNMFIGCSSLASIIAGNANIPAEEYAQIQNPNLLVYVNNASLAPQGVQNVVVNGVAQEIVLTDVESGNNNFFVPQSFTAGKVSYTRNFTQQTQPNVSRGWESISLPFNVQNIVHESKGDLSPFGSPAEGKKFWLRRLADNGLTRVSQIEANVPYVISMPNSTEYTDLYNLSGRVTFSSQYTTVPATTQQILSLADSSIVMMPTTLRVNRSSSVWAINVGEVRGQYLEGSVFERDYREVRPFEAYTVHRSNGPAPRFVPIVEMDADATGIEDVRGLMSDGRGDQWYDLKGSKLQQKPTHKGVYILNGTKVVIK